MINESRESDIYLISGIFTVGLEIDAREIGGIDELLQGALKPLTRR